MLFNSYIFILFFLPVTLALYFGLNHFRQEKAAKAALIAMSLWFYAYFHVGYLAVILSSILANYGISRALLKKGSPVWRRAVLWLGIIGNAGAIFYFKYFNFLLENINVILRTSFDLQDILMPLGISFFTFQQISYLVDSYRGETAGYGLLDYMLFVAFFPQLVAGPIVTHEEMMHQFQDSERKRFSQEGLARGLYLFSVGLAKKVLLADTLGRAADWGFGNPDALSAAATFVLSLLYVFQLYYDFSGYCDMACGIACMFRIDLPVNFNSPYQALSIADFWKRWHMSLTRFLRKYIYFPLGGNRKGKLRTWMNVLTVYLVSGIWHGANWTFILWGCIHGIAQVLYRIFGGLWDRLPKLLRGACTFLFVDMAFILSRADSPGDYGTLLSNILLGKNGGIPAEMTECFHVIEFTYLEDHVGALGAIASRMPSLHMWIVLGIAAGIAFFGRNCHEREFQPTLAKGLGCIALLVWSVMSLSGLSVFLYFNF